ncbi:MAG: EFR1 family ferrodoxin, partial [Anaerovoracaceae bacterium]
MFNILVVEDNADMRELFCTVLSDSGYQCIPAADGLEALAAMEQEYIDLIVADVMMPNMDGFELTKVLRETKYDLPILMVTAKDQFEDMQRGFRAGTDDYMVKPINVKELVLRVEALLRRAKIASEKKIVVGSTVLNPIMYAMMISAKGFKVTDKCTGCGQCESRCPLNNVKLTDGKPIWGKDCTHCMACIAGCPAEAIEYGKKTQGKPRY